MRAVALAALAAVAMSSPACAQYSKDQYCKWLPNMAGVVYCSVWRSKCDLAPRNETRQEIVERVFYSQQAPRYYFPVVSQEDLGTLVDEALDLKPDDPGNEKSAFMEAVGKQCFAEFDGVQADHARQSITR